MAVATGRRLWPRSAPPSGCSPSSSRGRWPSSATGCAAATTTSVPRPPGLAALFGALGIVWRLARKPVLSRFAHKLPYLGGVLLAIAGLVWAGKVATDAATGVGLLSTPTRWAIVVVAFVAVYLFVGITHLSIHRIYRKRLRRSFGVRRDAEGRLYSPHQRDQITWDQLPETQSGAGRVLRPPARRHRPRRSARRHVHDLASRGVHRRLRHVDREVPGADARRPGVRARRRVVDGDVRCRLRLGDGPLLAGHDERVDGGAEHRPRHLAAQPAPHVDRRRSSPSRATATCSRRSSAGTTTATASCSSPTAGTGTTSGWSSCCAGAARRSSASTPAATTSGGSRRCTRPSSSPGWSCRRSSPASTSTACRASSESTGRCRSVR